MVKSPMPAFGFRLQRGARSFALRLRELRMIAWGAMHTSHPIMAHIIPIRRCNLSCTYCNEYDDFSKPVPTETIVGRINRLADLGTVIVTLSGGEPLLHPDLDDIIRAMRRRGLIAGMITNGYLLTPDRVKRLNRAGSRYMYICEDGLVHYCSQQRGYPAKALDEYTQDDIRREYLTEKPCAPYCTVSCVHYVSYFDFWRGKQTLQSEMPSQSESPL